MTASRQKKDYFSIRYQADSSRSAVWREIIRALSKYLPDNPVTLELGPGYCDFINQLASDRKVAVDINPTAGDYAASDVEFIEGDCSELSMIPADSLDLVFASNLLEHLHKQKASELLQSAFTALKPSGRLILIQPNFRYSYDQYYDDYTHVTPYTDKGLSGLVESEGYQIVDCVPRFLPLSMKESTWIPRQGWIVRLYLNLPYRPMAKQMLLVAEKPFGQ